MNEKILNPKQTFRFRRFENKGFSIFRTLGKLITIAFLPIAYLQFWSVNLYAQDTVKLKQVIINSYRKPLSELHNFRFIKIISQDNIKAIPTENIANILSAAGITIKKRGWDNIQTDISINGAKPNQVLILLNGFPINDPQTGHFNTNLPISPEDIAQVEILNGDDASIYGINAMGGAINFKTYEDSTNSLYLKTALGNFNYQKYHAAITIKNPKNSHYLSFTHKNASGYLPDTDFDIYKAFYSLKKNTKKIMFLLQTGILWKNFGAYKFYTPKFPYQYEHNNTEISSASLFFKPINLRISLSYRRNQDKFELFREGNMWYQYTNGFFIKDNDTAWIVPHKIPYANHNYHASHTIYADITENFKTPLGKTYISFDYQYLTIFSTILGIDLQKQKPIPFENNKYFSKYAFSHYLSANLTHTITLLSNYETSFYINSLYYNKLYLNGGLNNALTLGKIKLLLNLNTASRMPSFTEMYYSDPVHKGNPNLRPEKSIQTELGIKLFSKKINLQLFAFYRIINDLIDWQAINQIYFAQNIPQVKIKGINADFYLISHLNKKIHNTFLINTNLLQYDANNKQGYYLSSVPKIYISINDFIRFKALELSTNITSFMYDYSSINSSNSHTLVNLKIEYQKKNFCLYFTLENALNTHYQYYYTPMPGRSFKIGISKKINL